MCKGKEAVSKLIDRYDQYASSNFLFQVTLERVYGRSAPESIRPNPIQSNPMSITEAGQGLYFRLFLKFKIQKHK